MEEGQASATAVAAALHRAGHLLWDDTPKIFQDPLALGLSGVASESVLQARLEAMQAAQARQSTPDVAQVLFRCGRTSVVLRQRYAEDALDDAVARGVGQYVILGAGLDSFAYRRPDLAAVLRVFEVDHPATQHWKRARLRDLNVTLPSNLTFIPLDFEQHTLVDGLHAGGHRPDVPTFFSWLGVTHYLTEEAVFTTLRYVASLAAGTEIVFQYYVARGTVQGRGPPHRKALEGMVKHTRGAGVEPVRAEHLGNTSAGARIHADLGRRTRGSGRTLLCGAHGWAPCAPPHAPHESEGGSIG